MVICANSHAGERGSAIVPILICFVVLNVLAMGVTMLVRSNIAGQERLRAKADIAALQTSLSMLFATAGECQRNLGAAGIGASVADIVSKSSANSLRVLWPVAGAAGTCGPSAPCPPAASNPFGAGSTYGALKVQNMAFAPPVALAAPFNGRVGYSADFTATVQTANGSVQSFTSPFYLVETGGVLSSCWITSYARPGVTMESDVCTRLFGASGNGPNTPYIYLPDRHVCQKAGP
jgi:hypothetical protein